MIPLSTFKNQIHILINTYKNGPHLYPALFNNKESQTLLLSRLYGIFSVYFDTADVYLTKRIIVDDVKSFLFYKKPIRRFETEEECALRLGEYILDKETSKKVSDLNRDEIFDPFFGPNADSDLNIPKLFPAS